VGGAKRNHRYLLLLSGELLNLRLHLLPLCIWRLSVRILRAYSHRQRWKNSPGDQGHGCRVLICGLTPRPWSVSVLCEMAPVVQLGRRTGRRFEVPLTRLAQQLIAICARREAVVCEPSGYPVSSRDLTVCRIHYTGKICTAQTPLR
jgi:hypothetical protein